MSCMASDCNAIAHLKRSGQAQDGAVSASRTGHRINRILGTAPYPTQLNTELIEVDSHADAGIEHVMDGPARINIFAAVAQDTGVSQRGEHDRAAVARHLLRRRRLRAVRKVTRCVIEPPAEILVCDAPVHFRIAIAARAGKGGIICANFRAQSGSKAPDIPAESNRLQLSTRAVKLNGRGKSTGVPAPGIIVNGTDLRSRLVVTQRNPAKPVVRNQGQASRDLGADVGSN